MKTAQRAARALTERTRRKGPVLSGGPSALPREPAIDGVPNRDCCGWSSVFTIPSLPLRGIFSHAPEDSLGADEVAAF